LSVADWPTQVHRIRIGPLRDELDCDTRYSRPPLREARPYGRLIDIRDEDARGINVLLQAGRLVPITGVIQTDDDTQLPPRMRLRFSSIDGEDTVDACVEPKHFEVRVPPGEYWPSFQDLAQGYAVTRLLAGGVNDLSRPLRADGETPDLTFVIS